MIVANWDYKIPNSKAVDAYNTARKYFEKYGSIGCALFNHLGSNVGSYSFSAGFENNANFGDFDDKVSNDEEFQKDMSPYFDVTDWENMNLYIPLAHKMEPDPGQKHCFAQWLFKYDDEEDLIKTSEVFFNYWMENGGNGGSVGTFRGSHIGQYGFGIRFRSMKDYGLAHDKLNEKNVWASHREFLNKCEFTGFNLSRVLESNWD